MRRHASNVPAFRQGLLAAIVILALSPMALAQSERPFCGLGPPPGSASFEQHERAQDQQRSALGYVRVCEDDLRRFDYASRARSMDRATARLNFTPVSLQSTPFEGFRALGGMPDHFGDGGASALHRTFKSPQGHIVDLFEWDMSVSGGQVKKRADLQTEQVNGAPAQLIVIQASSGKAVSILSWVEGRRHYELSVDVNVKTSTISPTLFQLASSIPKSVPARLDEPDLRWPALPPVPRPAHR